jgi:hypothetical protein
VEQSLMAMIDIQVDGLFVAHIWRGYGDTLFIELGELTPSTKVRRDGTAMNPAGQVSVEFHGGWRIESAQDIRCGSASKADEVAPVLAALSGRKISALATVGRLPEISLTLDDDCYLTSFTAVSGDPDWTVADRRAVPHRWFNVRGGVVTVGDGGPRE